VGKIGCHEPHLKPLLLRPPKSVDHWKESVLAGPAAEILKKQLDIISVQESKIEKYSQKIQTQSKKISSLSNTNFN